MDRNKLFRSYGVVKDQLHIPEDYLFNEFKLEYNINKKRKRDLTNKELWLLINFILGYMAREYGEYLIAPGETYTEKLFSDETNK